MQEQNFANHARFVKAFHGVLSLLLLAGVILSFVNIYFQWKAHYYMLNSILIALLFVCVLLTALFARQFALKAQDRAIRAEENFRHYILTNKPLENTLTMQQIIALRFAPDSEFIALAARAAKDKLSPVEIKKEIKTWRPDYHRV